jgi:hypothetical protein
MAVITIDTHEFFNKLKGVGFSIEQAEVIAQMHKETAAASIEQARNDYHLDELITKRDLKDTENEFKRDMKELELKIELVRRDMAVIKSDLQTGIEKSRADIIALIIRLGFLQTGLIVALLLKVLNMI